METSNLNPPASQIAEFCRKWSVTELSLFGSVLRADFGPDSDVDVLLTFAPEAGISLFDYAAMQDELEAIFGRTVDVVSRSSVERTENPFRKNAILGSARTIYPHRGADLPSAPGASVRLDRDPGLLYDMVASAHAVRKFIDGITRTDFARDDITISAASQVLGVLGRAAEKISAKLREQHPEIDWIGMALFADRLLREYREVSADEVWGAAQSAVAAIPILEPLVPPYETESKSSSDYA
ncbi:nucleotidyltransferase domain-containing protein [Longimicrobium sp.]|jgi:hypothetical protein|uniref:nucleotidyltransferase domain-containing protein n=1 Tax=Longimicrobium sp. TaxID=2029185 RepID=UPI002EDAA326